MKKLLAFLLCIPFMITGMLGPASDPIIVNLLEDNRAEVIRLINLGLDVNRTEPAYGSPLIVAISKGDLEIIKLLLEHGANPNQVLISPTVETKNMTPLMVAVGHPQKNLEVIKLLLRFGADPNKVVNGESALLWANEIGDPALVEILMSPSSASKIP